jgi:threonine dehydratase
MITPQKSYPDLTRAVGVSSLYLKREDLHPYGSHKGRSIPVMIDHYLKEGKRHFAISSSGNAALAAALHIKKINEKNNALAHNASSAATQDERNKGASVVVSGAGQELEKIKLEILVGNHILDKKFKKLTDLADYNVSVMRFERPLQSLTQKTADSSIQSLRQSTDDVALVGYESLAEELEQIKDLQAVFLATSSGTTAQELAEYFLKNNNSVEIHIVQTTSCHPMALEFVDSLPSEEQSSADAIVDITANRKAVLIPLIQKTNGFGWIASNEEIMTAQELIEKNADIKVSPNGALALAGLMQAVFNGREWGGDVVCVVGGE